jgi:hypothetical protein
MHERRRTRARLDPEAVIELIKPESPKEGEPPFGAAFPNIEYEEPARLQVRRWSLSTWSLHACKGFGQGKGVCV